MCKDACKVHLWPQLPLAAAEAQQPSLVPLRLAPLRRAVAAGRLPEAAGQLAEAEAEAARPLLLVLEARLAEVPGSLARLQPLARLAPGHLFSEACRFLPRQAALWHPPVQDAVSHEAGQFSQNGSPALTPSNVLPSFNQYHAAPRHARGGD